MSKAILKYYIYMPPLLGLTENMMAAGYISQNRKPFGLSQCDKYLFNFVGMAQSTHVMMRSRGNFNQTEVEKLDKNDSKSNSQ